MSKLVPLFTLSVILISQGALGGEIITAQEVESYLYADGKMEHSKGQFEDTYYLEGDTVTRTRIYDLQKKEVIPDKTVYRIQRSDPAQGLLSSREPVIRAIGQPGPPGSIEILVIGKTFIQSVRSSSDYFVVSRSRRIK